MARILTKTERQVQAYQAQGGYPGGQLVNKSYSLFDTVTFTAAATEYTLFTGKSGDKFTTNLINGSAIPAGQSFLALGISVSFDQVTTVDAEQAPVLQAFYAMLRNSLWKFAKTNEDWSAYFPGDKMLPSVTSVTAAAGNRVGDVVKSGILYKFAVPTVLGASNTFDFSIQLPAALGAGNVLVTEGTKMRVYLDGLITKKQAT